MDSARDRGCENADERHEETCCDRRRGGQVPSARQVNAEQYLKRGKRDGDDRDGEAGNAERKTCDGRRQIVRMSDLQRSGDDEQRGKHKPRDEGDDMSTRAERRRKERQNPLPSETSAGGWMGLAVAVVALVAIAIYAWVRAHGVSSAAVEAMPTMPPPAKVGTRAIPFEIDTPAGPFVSTSLAGKPYLLEIFATWCPHCQRETQVLRAVRAAIPPTKLFMLSVSGSPFGAASTAGNNVPESQSDVDAFDAHFGVNWLALYDANLSVARLWGMIGFPTIYVVDKAGVIRYWGQGDQDKSTLMKGIAKAGVR